MDFTECTKRYHVKELVHNLFGTQGMPESNPYDMTDKRYVWFFKAVESEKVMREILEKHKGELDSNIGY